ncbi:MAG: cytochrome c family protein [Chitinispirillaceae bacterium]|nr:cytochrome c family protein [Chitinispirillaceae bacterium]
MKRAIVCLSIVACVLSVSAIEPRYIGAAKCAKMCHKGEKKGNQYEIWQKSKHAGAFKTLGTDSSKEVAKKANVTGDPQKSPECLRCHVTAFGVKKELVDSTCTYNQGVGCEACHGPGSEYRKLGAMKKHDMAVKAGLWEQNEALCIKCHNKESPTYKPFNFIEAVKKDAHPIPGKKAKE